MVQPVIVSMTPTASREMWMVLESLSSLYQWAWLLALVTAAAAAVALQRSFKGPRSFTIGFTWGQHARVQVSLESSFTPLSESIATSSGDLKEDSEPQALKNETSVSAIEGVFLDKPLAASWETKMVLVIGNKGFSSFSSRTKLYSCGDGYSLFGVNGRKSSDCSCKHDFFEEYEEYDEYAGNSSCCKGTGGKGKLPEVYDRDMNSGWSFSMPEWANSLLQPLSTDDLQLVSLDSDWNFASDSSSLKGRSNEWDAVLEMHREMDWKEIARSILRDPRRVLRPTIVSKGPLYFAKAKDEVVRLWSSSKRRLLRTLYLPQEEGPVSALDLNWGEAASVGTSNGFLSLWDVASAKRLRSFKGSSSSAAPLKAVRMNADAGVLAGAATADGCCSSSSSSSSWVSLWDSRAMGRNAAGSRAVSNVFGLESVGNELYVREGLESVRGYDLRMLGSSRPPLHEVSVRNYGLASNTEQAETTMRGEKKLQEETWWDAEDAELEEEEEEDDDDDDCDDSCSCSGDGGSSSSGKSMLSRCFGAVCRSAGLLL